MHSDISITENCDQQQQQQSSMTIALDPSSHHPLQASDLIPHDPASLLPPPSSHFSLYFSSAISSNFEHLLAFSLGREGDGRCRCTCCNAAVYKGHSPNATLATDQRSPRHPNQELQQEQLIPQQLTTCRNLSIKSGYEPNPPKGPKYLECFGQLARKCASAKEEAVSLMLKNVSFPSE